MAAGEGRRLRPLTLHWPKPVLPVDGRPVIATLLRELAAARIVHVTVVVGHLREQVERLLGDGGAFGVSVRYAVQPSADGSADAVARALAAGATTPCLVSAADTVFDPGVVAATAEAFAQGAAAGAIGVRSGRAPTPGKPGVVIADGRIVRVYDLDPGLRHTSAPLWALGEPLAPFLEGLRGPPFELKDAYQRAIDAGLEVLALPVGSTRDLTDPVDLVEENFSYLRGIE